MIKLIKPIALIPFLMGLLLGGCAGDLNLAPLDTEWDSTSDTGDTADTDTGNTADTDTGDTDTGDTADTDTGDTADTDSSDTDTVLEPLAIIGLYTTDDGTNYNISQDVFWSGLHTVSQTVTITQYSNAEQYLVGQNDDGTWSRVDWMVSADDLYFCHIADDAATEDIAVINTTADRARGSVGCNGEAWGIWAPQKSWVAAYGDSASNLSTGFSDVTVLSDGMLGAVGVTKDYGTSNDQSDYVVIKADRQGGVRWAMRINPGIIGSVDWAIDVVADMQGGMLILGTRDGSGVGRDGWAIRLDYAGNVIWQRAFGPATARVSMQLRVHRTAILMSMAMPRGRRTKAIRKTMPPGW